MADFFRDELGQSMLESGLLIGVIAIMSIVALATLGKKVVAMFSNINSAFDSINV